MNEDVLELHPFAKLAFLALTTQDGKTYVMSDAARERLVLALEKLFGKPDLRSAVVSLVSLAKHVEDAGSVRAADALISLAATACDALKKQGAASKRLAEDLGEMTTATFAAFSDRELAVVRSAPAQQTAKHVKSSSLTIASINASKRKIIR
jgi:hypothetical protein